MTYHVEAYEVDGDELSQDGANTNPLFTGESRRVGNVKALDIAIVGDDAKGIHDDFVIEGMAGVKMSLSEPVTSAEGADLSVGVLTSEKKRIYLEIASAQSPAPLLALSPEGIYQQTIPTGAAAFGATVAENVGGLLVAPVQDAFAAAVATATGAMKVAPVEAAFGASAGASVSAPLYVASQAGMNAGTSVGQSLGATMVGLGGATFGVSVAESIGGTQVAGSSYVPYYPSNVLDGSLRRMSSSPVTLWAVMSPSAGETYAFYYWMRVVIFPDTTANNPTIVKDWWLIASDGGGAGTDVTHVQDIAEVTIPAYTEPTGNQRLGLQFNVTTTGSAPSLPAIHFRWVTTPPTVTKLRGKIATHYDCNWSEDDGMNWSNGSASFGDSTAYIEVM